MLSPRDYIGEQMKKKIRIGFSEEDLQDLINGNTFDWNFDGVDVHLYNSTDEDEDEE